MKKIEDSQLSLNRPLLFCEETEEKSLNDSSMFPWEVMFCIFITHCMSLQSIFKVLKPKNKP